MQHLDEGTIHSWLDGALSADEAARVEAHVKECAQCQAAVAEARGFIAASSRILTALDNAPRGVIPAAKPKRRVDPIMWRIAATVLVVAAGTLVVVRNSGLTGRASESSSVQEVTPTENAPAATTMSEPAIPATVPSPAPAAVDMQRVEGVGTTEKSAAISRRAGVVSGVATAPAVRTGAAVTAQQQSRVDGADGDKRPAAGAGKAAARETANAAVADAEPSAPPPTARPPIVLRGANRSEALAGRAAGVMAADAAAAEPKLRVVGPPRALGQKITLYEVAPGDTVVLAEQLTTELQQVVTAAAAAPTAMGAVSGERTRASAKVGAFADTSSKSATQAQASAPAAPGFTAAPDGVATLTWKDSATGTVLKLSGRHTRVELEEIRRRIERAKSAAADSAKKNR